MAEIQKQQPREGASKRFPKEGVAKPRGGEPARGSRRLFSSSG